MSFRAATALTAWTAVVAGWCRNSNELTSDPIGRRRDGGSFRLMWRIAVVANHATPTNMRLGAVLTPGQAVARLRPGDIALARIDVHSSFQGIEPGLWALDLLEQRGITVLNPRTALISAHDKLATAQALTRSGLPHPRSEYIAPGLPFPQIEAPVVLKPRFGSWGRDVVLCSTSDDLATALREARLRVWFNTSGGIVQQLVPPRGFDLRIVVAGKRVIGAARRVATSGEWRTNVALGARRVPTSPPPDACLLALAAASAIGGDLVGVDLLPTEGGWTILEINGAVDFTAAYSLDSDVFSAARSALFADAMLRHDSRWRNPEIHALLGHGVASARSLAGALARSGPRTEAVS